MRGQLFVKKKKKKVWMFVMVSTRFWSCLRKRRGFWEGLLNETATDIVEIDCAKVRNKMRFVAYPSIVKKIYSIFGHRLGECERNGEKSLNRILHLIILECVPWLVIGNRRCSPLSLLFLRYKHHNHLLNGHQIWSMLFSASELFFFLAQSRRHK